MSTLCKCGCGEVVDIKRYKSGNYHQPKYFPGHYQPRPQVRRGADNHSWKGGRTRISGYVKVRAPNHPRADEDGYIMEHILVAEEVLGKFLPIGAVVHHINENRSDNRRSNLVICDSSSYHSTLHRRMRARDACGHAHWRKCWICKQYDDPANLRLHKHRNTLEAVHGHCRRRQRQ